MQTIIVFLKMSSLCGAANLRVYVFIMISEAKVNYINLVIPEIIKANQLIFHGRHADNSFIY